MSQNKQIWKWSLPHQVTQVLEKHHAQCENLGLLLDKFSPYANYGDQQHPDWNLTPDSKKKDGKQKIDWLKTAISLRHTERRQQLIHAQQERWIEFVINYAGDTSAIFQMCTASPLIVGLGEGHVLETSITLDRNSGAPIIPGSALKGLARATALIEIVQNLPFHEDESKINYLNKIDDFLSGKNPKDADDEKTSSQRITELTKAIDKQSLHDFRAVFGTVAQVGSAIFVDGIYADDNLPRFHVDIMNPHFGDYYINQKPPSDDLSPIPVTYLTVARGQHFAFAVLPRTPNDIKLIRKAMRWLIEGLTKYGVGAKTAQGYGLFEQG
jgi:CRISPR-associated protein Cmr6